MLNRMAKVKNMSQITRREFGRITAVAAVGVCGLGTVQGQTTHEAYAKGIYWGGKWWPAAEQGVEVNIETHTRNGRHIGDEVTVGVTLTKETYKTLAKYWLQEAPPHALWVKRLRVWDARPAEVKVFGNGNVLLWFKAHPDPTRPDGEKLGRIIRT